ncbi:MAG: hypothetical protein A2W90_09435 [Bacteroidetes bacterium GWF2_42_66]|nr:MAG: hypothetical protein A2W92_00125 [Bacteroidetes bacterium GWA2_42_15]OFY01730.1 MAG: hypothetical protein A2W89_22640 [Bacteroidetes bacterium GWE2_42_39]OFY46477.1 MAG: hypothetical protein A2W90_09435 [Bacteroidetes bacterium GWF2_42_66]HAZ02938.1 hypothetical protein [Marinilabiliales bacterium]HBL76117.1 hypothetical protein [Prolixibacteraceae bacterium]
MKYAHIIFLMVVLFTPSCIDWGLGELPSYKESEILDLDFEYRYTVKNDNGVERLAVKQLQNKTVISENTIYNYLTIPNASGSFTEEIVKQIALTNIIGYADISTGAIIKPIEGAPELGEIGDYSSVLKYKVIAANGDSKIWTIYTTLTN